MAVPPRFSHARQIFLPPQATSPGHAATAADRPHSGPFLTTGRQHIPEESSWCRANRRSPSRPPAAGCRSPASAGRSPPRGYPASGHVDGSAAAPSRAQAGRHPAARAAAPPPGALALGAVRPPRGGGGRVVLRDRRRPPVGRSGRHRDLRRRPLATAAAGRHRRRSCRGACGGCGSCCRCSTGPRSTTSGPPPRWSSRPSARTRTSSTLALDTWLGQDPDQVIVVLDVADTEAQRRLLARNDPRLRVIMFKHAGKRSALGVGIRAARGEILVLTDSDTRLDRGPARERADAVRRPRGRRGEHAAERLPGRHQRLAPRRRLDHQQPLPRLRARDRPGRRRGVRLRPHRRLPAGASC